MVHSNVQLLDLPDELLLLILRQLRNLDVLHSLFGVNVRLNRIVNDPCFVSEISFIESKENPTGQTETVLDRFLMEILPNIDHLITTLKVPSTLMERVLFSADYSNLSRLDVFIPDAQPVIHIEGEKISLYPTIKSNLFRRILSH